MPERGEDTGGTPAVLGAELDRKGVGWKSYESWGVGKFFFMKGAIMPGKGRQSDVQKKFLRNCAEQRKPAREVIEEMGTKRHFWEQWLGSAAFAEGVKRRMAGMRLMRDLDIARGAEEGARRLAKAAMGNGDFEKSNLYERRACVELVKLGLAIESAARAERRERREMKRRAREVKQREGEVKNSEFDDDVSAAHKLAECQARSMAFGINFWGLETEEERKAMEEKQRAVNRLDKKTVDERVRLWLKGELEKGEEGEGRA